MHARAAARDVAGGELPERSFRALRAALLLGGAGAARGPFGGPRENHKPGDFLANIGVAVRTGLFGALDDQVNASRALRIPRVRLIGDFELGPLFGVNPADARSAARRRCEAVGSAALMRQRGHRDLPSPVHLAD